MTGSRPAESITPCERRRGGSSLSEAVALPPWFLNTRLFRQWSGDSQKLYFWLRARVGRDEPAAPDEYHRLEAAGYLVAYATAEEMMERAVACSRNTLTKLIRELADLDVAQVRPARRGYLFLMGERLTATMRRGRRPVLLDVYYLDQIAASLDVGSSPAAGIDVGVESPR